MNIIKMLIKYCKIKRKHVKLAFGARLSPGSIFDGNNYIGRRTRVKDSYIGTHSYIGSDSDLSYCKIGKYCSIGSSVRVINGFHPTNTFVSTHPAFYSVTNKNIHSFVNKQKYEEFKYYCDKYFLVIGNDVWIGTDVSIVAGINIGDGAIIASGALVTKDVAPYSIVGGIPAKEIKKRFSDEIIKKLLDIKWWDYSEEWISQHADLFDNIDGFLKLEQRN